MSFDGKFGDDLQPVGGGYGWKSPFGMLLPPGGRVAAYVRHVPLDLDDAFISSNRVPTLASALTKVRSGAGDTIIVLPGHSESVTDGTMFANAVAGTKIIGAGRGSNMPVFRWTATGSQWALAVADLLIAGLRLRLEGANGVTKAILVTAADVGIVACDIEMASGATAKAAIGIEVGAGGTRFELSENIIRGSADIVTDPIKVVAAVDGVAIRKNDVFCAATAATGIIHVTAAATNLRIRDNDLAAIGAASAAAIGVDNVAATGVISRNMISCLVTGAHTSNTSGIALGAAALIRCFQNFAANDPRSSGLLQPAVDT